VKAWRGEAGPPEGEGADVNSEKGRKGCDGKKRRPLPRRGQGGPSKKFRCYYQNRILKAKKAKEKKASERQGESRYPVSQERLESPL